LLSLSPSYTGRYFLYRRDETVSTTRQGFDESRALSRIGQRVAQSFDRRVEADIEIDKCVGRPKLLVKVFPGHQLARLLKQHGQDLKGLIVKLDLDALLV
jgi:hypothetical protein